MASTPKGVGNKFHELVSKAEEGRNDFALEKAFGLISLAEQKLGKMLN